MIAKQVNQVHLAQTQTMEHPQDSEITLDGQGSFNGQDSRDLTFPAKRPNLLGQRESKSRIGIGLSDGSASTVNRRYGVHVSVEDPGFL
jgi:hypothetical protein